MPWRKWGPYLSERQWGTVREDCSVHGDAWSSFTHDHARSRAYQWGEDGLAGICDDQQRLCFALALWNGHDPILKERLFGLSNAEGNHGEDVKEYYFYLDSTPTHSYMKWLYKYPQRTFPYAALIDTNARRSRRELEYELIDTGVFAGDEYFDVEVEYAKAGTDDLLIRITATNCGPRAAAIHVLPTLWFRNTWHATPRAPRPSLRATSGPAGAPMIAATHADLGRYWLYADGDARLLFTDNETNTERLFGRANASGFVKDGINDAVIHGRHDSVNAQGVGTKSAVHYQTVVEAGRSAVWQLRLSNLGPQHLREPFAQMAETMTARRRESDEFYRTLIPASASAAAGDLMRQAMAGMLWSKQYYHLDVAEWLGERPTARNAGWTHLLNADIISMPDKWEYPSYAAWALPFHALALSSVDLDFAKEQLDLMLGESYLHPSGQIPASESNFSAVNPPVHAWATAFLYRSEQMLRGSGDVDFLKRSFGKLLANYSWWANRRDRLFQTVFDGGFLGLDGIGIFDRSAPVPASAQVEPSDSTPWMALFCQNMLEIAVEIASEDRTFEDMAVKFIDQFLAIAHTLNTLGQIGMWDDEDGFYYDVLRLPDGSATRLKARSIAGLLPLCATTVVEPWQRRRVPRIVEHARERIRRTPSLQRDLHLSGDGQYGFEDRILIALVDQQRLKRLLRLMLSEDEFLSPYGIRSLSRAHHDRPAGLRVGGTEYRVAYMPAESDSDMFGGNANWRGPIWIPLNVLLIRALLQFYQYYGETFTVECPTGSGRRMHLFDVAKDIARRLESIFLRDETGRRPVHGDGAFQKQRSWQNRVLFYEYFDGDTGAGLGASHLTGWSGLVAPLIDIFARVDAQSFLMSGRSSATRGAGVRSRVTRERSA